MRLQEEYLPVEPRVAVGVTAVDGNVCVCLSAFVHACMCGSIGIHHLTKC